jgi:DNA-binding NarL/FixJ family response regulator
MTKTIRILIADDHKLFRAGIRSLLQSVEDFEVVAEASNGRDAIRFVEAHRPDIVLLDIMMPELNGLEAAIQITYKSSVIILSMNADEDSVLKSLRAGAVGYLVKTSDPAELGQAIRAAARGETFLSSVVSAHVIAACLDKCQEGFSSLERLTPRQREVLQLVAEGHTTKEIARKLQIGVKTVEAHRGELMRALDIHDIANLTRYAIKVGLVALNH